MKKIYLLFKKDFIESLASFRVEKKDILGFISSSVLMALIYGVFIFVFNNFAKMYIETDFQNPILRNARVEEILIIGIMLVFVVNVILGVRKIHSVISNNKDNDVLIHQPIDVRQIFLYKLLKIYFSQVSSTLLIILPLSVVLDFNSELVGCIVYYLFCLSE